MTMTYSITVNTVHLTYDTRDEALKDWDRFLDMSLPSDTFVLRDDSTGAILSKYTHKPTPRRDEV